jgi:hypothetical protein
MPDDKFTLLDVSTKAPAPDPVRNQEAGLHHIRVVGGGAAGIELVTRLGDTLGRRAGTPGRASPSSRKAAPISGNRYCTPLRRAVWIRAGMSSITSRRRTGITSVIALAR